MSTFLKKISDYITETYKDDLENVCIVLPNRRASIYLKKHISEKVQKNIWAPQIFSIEDFVYDLSDFSLADNLTLFFELYKIHQEIEGSNAKTFDDFQGIAEMMLHDFNEIDLYLGNAKEIYSYLSDSTAISLWNLDGKELTDFQKSYLKFYQSLYQYYLRLNEEIKKLNILYQGGLYKDTAEKIEEKIKCKTWDSLIFAGFNALTGSEEKIIRTLQKSGIAKVFWDADEYYLNNPLQEAGKFLRKYKQEWISHKFEWVEENIKTDKKNIDIIGIPMKLGQAKYCGEIIKKFANDNNKIENTAIILNDENLLIPVLNSIPDEVESFNVTMGLSLKNTPLFNLVDNLLQLQENRIKYGNNNEKSYAFYFKDIIKVLGHPYLVNSFNYNEIISRINLSNRTFYSAAELQKAKTDLFSNIEIEDIIFNKWNNAREAITYLLDFINLLKTRFEDKTIYILENEYLYHFSKALQQFTQSQYFKEESVSILTFRNLLTRIISNQSIPFYGEPLEGLQIMGMLETRTLDFDNIILVSVNEGILPSSRSFNSFIPVDIKRQFKLPDYTDKDAVFAYHFYRLIQRAKNISILYNTEPDEFSGGDKSRFIYQIINELPKYNSNISINNLFVNITSDSKIKKRIIKYEKSVSVLKKLKKISVNGFSASKLNDYINCSLQFYFKHIAEISEPDETEEKIAANTMGSVIHEVLSELFKPFSGKIIRKTDISNMFNKIEALTKNAFNHLYKDGDTSSGINLLTSNMAKLYVSNLLKSEIKYLDNLAESNQLLTINMLEQKLECIIETNNEDIPLVKLKGYVDRIDIAANILRIIDYKTGNVEPKDLKANESKSIINDPKYAKSLQLLVYALLYQKENPENNYLIKAGIISLRNQMHGFMNLVFEGNDLLTKTNIQQFEELIISLFDEIFNLNQAFIMTENEENCKYCSYIEICGR